MIHILPLLLSYIVHCPDTTDLISAPLVQSLRAERRILVNKWWAASWWWWWWWPADTTRWWASLSLISNYVKTLMRQPTTTQHFLFKFPLLRRLRWTVGSQSGELDGGFWFSERSYSCVSSPFKCTRIRSDNWVNLLWIKFSSQRDFNWSALSPLWGFSKPEETSQLRRHFPPTEK